MVLVLSVDIPDEYRSGLTSEPIADDGYRYTGHLYNNSNDDITFDLADITAEFQRAINARIQDAISKSGAIIV